MRRALATSAVAGSIREPRHPPAWLAPLRRDDLGEARARANRVAQRRFTHEGAAARRRLDQSLVGQRGQGPAQRVAIDAEALGEFGLGRQARARRQPTLENLGLDALGNLLPQRDARAAGNVVGSGWRHHSVAGHRYVRTNIGRGQFKSRPCMFV